jgi:hypothetical protein
VAGQTFSQGTPVSSTNKTDRHDITEILLKVTLKTINPKPPQNSKTIIIKEKYKTVKINIYFIKCTIKTI